MSTIILRNRDTDTETRLHVSYCWPTRNNFPEVTLSERQTRKIRRLFGIRYTYYEGITARMVHEGHEIPAWVRDNHNTPVNF